MRDGLYWRSMKNAERAMLAAEEVPIVPGASLLAEAASTEAAPPDAGADPEGVFDPPADEHAPVAGSQQVPRKPFGMKPGLQRHVLLLSPPQVPPTQSVAQVKGIAQFWPT